jgi:uncharacterized protein YndB with AHSA1/START domain
MPHEFEIARELEVDATPEQVWEAVSTGPGWDSWFMGRNEIEPGEGGAVRWSIGGFTATSTITAWDPPKRFVSRGDEGPDGSLHQFDYQIEPREGGGSSIKYVHSGLLGGDDWETEYAAMNEGDPMYLQKLAEYVTYFSGRFATPIDAHGPNVPDREQAFAVMRAGLGLSGNVAEGDRVRLTPDGFTPIEGVVDCVSPSFLGVRTSDALYRFIYGFDGSVMIGHHLFTAGVDQRQAEQEWASWLDRLFSPAAGGGASSG